MPEVDKLLNKMAQSNLNRVLMISDQPIRLFSIGGGEATGPALTIQKLHDIVKEIAPAHLISQLDNNGQIQFPYKSPHGLFNIAAERSDSKLQVDITPFAAASSTVAPANGTAAPARPQAAMPPNLTAPPAAPSFVTPSPPIAPPSSSTLPHPSSQATKFLPLAAFGVVVLLLVGAVIFATSLRSSRDKVAQQEQSQAQEQQAGDAYSKYTQEINGLSQIGVTVETIGSGPTTYEIAKEDTSAYNAAVADIEKRVKADPALEGSETTGQKAELLKALQDAAQKNSPFNRALAINKQSDQKVARDITLEGKSALGKNDIRSYVTKTKGYKAYEELASADNNDEMAPLIAKYFPG